MEGTDVEKSSSSEETGLNRNRSFKSKQLVRSQAIRESQSPPRTISPASPPNIAPTSPTPSVANASPTPSAANASPPPSVSPSERTVNESSHISVSVSSDVNSIDDAKKKLPVEIQITSGGWEGPGSEGGARRLARDRGLLSHSPRTACVCGACAACPHCRGRRRRPTCPTKQDSGIVCSDDCPDCSDDTGAANNNDVIKKANSVDFDDQTYCRCPERKERTKNVSLSRNDSDDRNEISGPELVSFIKDTLNKNPRDRIALLKIEKELHALVNDTGRCIVRFPVMTSYGRMLVHRCAALFQLSHHLDMSNKTSVLVSKSGTSGGRLPCTSFRAWCTTHFPASPRHVPDVPAKSILKRDTHSLDEPGSGSMSCNRSKSLEQRERDYERVRRRIFSSDNCNQQEDGPWPWISGPVKVLTSDGRNKLLKVHSLEGRSGQAASWRNSVVSKSHSFGGYAGTEPHTTQPRLLSRQGDLASSSWRLSPSSSGYKTLSLRSTDSITPSPTGGASPEPGCEPGSVVWAVTDMSAVPPGAVVIHPQTGRALTNPDGSVYHFDPHNPPLLCDTQTDIHKVEQNEKRRGRLEKQHSFMDNDCECPPPSDECRAKCCCECRRHDAVHKGNNHKEPNPKPSSPTYETNTQTNAQEPKYEITNQNPQHFEPTNQNQPHYETTNQNQPHYEPTNQKQPHFESTNQNPESYEPTNQRYERYETANQRELNKPVKSQEQDVQYQYQGFRPEEMSSPPQLSAQYLPQDVTSQAKVAPIVPDPNIRPMSLSNITNVVYPNIAQGYPYQCRVDPHVQMYQPLVQPEEQKMAHHNNETFRIDPSYPYAAVDYSCGACVDTNVMPPQRSYSVPFGQMELPPVMGQYGMHNVMLQPQLQPYPYQEQLQWPGVSQPPKLVMPDLYPILQYPQPYPHYNIVYPQVIPQPYPVCQPMYPVTTERISTPNNRNSKRNSTSNSARNTPMTDDKVPYDDKTRHDPTHIKHNTENTQNTQNFNNRQTFDSNRQNYDSLRQNSDTRFDSSRQNDSRQSFDSRQNVETRHYEGNKQNFDRHYDGNRQNAERNYENNRQNSENRHFDRNYEQSFDKNRHFNQTEVQNRDFAQNSSRETSENQDISRNPELSRQNSEIAAKIQQIKNQMAQMNVRDKRKDEWKRRNSGYGLLGNCPVNNFNGKPMGRPPTNDETHLSSAARAIVNSIRNIQVKHHNTYQPEVRREARYDKPEVRVHKRECDVTPRHHVPVFRQPYLLRQMTPGTWCRRSPAPVHPVLNQPRRPPPDTRNPRR